MAQTHSRNHGSKPTIWLGGVGPAVLGEIPVVKVRRAMAAESTGVAGVVDQHFLLHVGEATLGEASVTLDRAEESAIPPGDYLTLVTLGADAAVKVDASGGAIHAGDLLVSSATPGHAQRAQSPVAGAIVGKALGEQTSGAGMIAALVTLQ